MESFHQCTYISWDENGAIGKEEAGKDVVAAGEENEEATTKTKTISSEAEVVLCKSKTNSSEAEAVLFK